VILHQLKLIKLKLEVLKSDFQNKKIRTEMNLQLTSKISLKFAVIITSLYFSKSSRANKLLIILH